MPAITTEKDHKAARAIVEVENATIRFAGDSGDGMQLTGTQFTNTSAIFGTTSAPSLIFRLRFERPPGPCRV